MGLQSLQHLIGAIESQDGFKVRRQLQQLIACWETVVGAVVAAQTRPVGIQRNVLHVAAASPVWAQNLAFERMRILHKLNARLGSELTDIRFSTAQWSRNPDRSPTRDTETNLIWREHPSRIKAIAASSQSASSQAASSQDAGVPAAPRPATPQAAFQQWAQTVQTRSQQLPICPHCQCPTPQGEITRWSVCALCAAKQFK